MTNIKQLWEDYILDEDCDLTDIPDEIYTQEFFNEYFETTNNIKKIPQRFVTQEMCEKYFELTKDINQFPSYYRNQEMWNYYFFEMKHDKHKFYVIEWIPEEFQTQEMWNDIFYNQPEWNCDKAFFEYIPSNFKTKQMCIDNVCDSYKIRRMFEWIPRNILNEENFFNDLIKQLKTNINLE